MQRHFLIILVIILGMSNSSASNFYKNNNIEATFIKHDYADSCFKVDKSRQYK